MNTVALHKLSGKVCVVTGATRGIGRAAAEALARMGATVIVHGRHPDAVETTSHEISESAGNESVTGIVGSFDSLADVRRIAGEILTRHERLDVLLNNAGTASLQRRPTSEGHEWQFGVNHLAPFLLTNLLLNRLTEGAPARIVNVSSAAHRRGAIDFDDLNWERRRYDSLQAYSDSKLANILFTRALAARLDGTGVTANCLHPGVVATNIFAGLGPLGRIFGILARPLLLSPRAGAQTSIYLAAAPEAASFTGEYFDKSAVARTTPAGEDREAAQRLWDASAELVGLPPGAPVT